MPSSSRRTTTRDILLPRKLPRFAALGEKDQAMTWLEKGYEERFNLGALLRLAFDPLRSDPRFQDLWQRMGLPR